MNGLPEQQVVPLRGGPIARWGVVAPGWIADAFVTTVLANTDQRVTAVASRSAERAAQFARRHGIARAHGAYADLLADPDVDIVYIAAPNSEHLPLSLLAIEAGKAVLIEKPLALDAAEGRRIAAAAEAAGVFAGEAMWSAYLPQYDVLRRLLRRGDLGAVRIVTTDVCVPRPEDPASRLFDPALGGGVSLDLGVYGWWFVQSVIGRPEDVRAVGTRASSGVDDQVLSVLRGQDGALGAVTTSFRTASTSPTEILAEYGSIRFLDQFVFPGGLTVTHGDDVVEWHDRHGLVGHEGLAWQATAIADLLDAGRVDSPAHPIADAIAVLETMDAVRAQVLSTTPTEQEKS